MISSICSKDSIFIQPWKKMFSRDQSWNIVVKEEVREVPEEFWSLTHPDGKETSKFIQKDYVTAMSTYCNTWIALFYKNNLPSGYAVFYLSTFQSSEIQHQISKCWGVRDWMAKRWANTSRVQHVLVCGNPLISGEHGFIFSIEDSPAQLADVLCDAMNMMVKEVNRKGLNLSICIIKDFYPHQQWLQAALGKCGFSPLQGDPIMTLPISPRWKSQTDYQQDLISKFRSKSITAYQKSQRLTKVRFSLEEMESRVEEWYPLFEQVYERAQYKWKRLSSDAIVQWKRALGEQAQMQVYQIDEKVIGFSMSVFGQDEMEALMVGIDYDYNKEYQVYSRMLYDFIEQGIEAKMSFISFGRTALEIKSSVGALPFPAIALMRHSRSVTNFLVRWLVTMFQPEQVELRQVWKQEAYAELSGILKNR